MEKAKVSELSSIQTEDGQGFITDTTIEKISGAEVFTMEAKDLEVKMQEKEKAVPSRKRYLQEECENIEGRRTLPLLRSIQTA